MVSCCVVVVGGGMRRVLLERAGREARRAVRVRQAEHRAGHALVVVVVVFPVGFGDCQSAKSHPY